MLRIHEELQRGTTVNCTSLAAVLEVSIRTIMRDLEFMRERLELPIQFDPISNSFRYTRPVTEFPALKVGEGELFALLVARKALEQYRGTSFYQQLASSFDKLSAGLRDTVTFTPTDELQAVSFRNIGIGKLDLSVFNDLSRAVTRKLEVAFDYRKPGDTKIERRTIHPYHLAHRENLWYVVGFDTLREALRTFALPRISKLSVRKTHFERPANFSPEKFFANALGVVGGDKQFEVIIRFTGVAADRIREREWHESQKMKDLPDGGLELTLKLGALEEIERWVLSWGAAAEVVGPQELRDRVKATIAKMAEQYK